MIRKRCARCRRLKPLSAFNASHGAPDGLQGYCRTCQRTYAREYRTHNAAARTPVEKGTPTPPRPSPHSTGVPRAAQKGD